MRMMWTMTERTSDLADLSPTGPTPDPVRPVPVDLGPLDDRTRRVLATADQKVRAADAAADRELRTRAGRVRLRREERQVRRQERADQRADRRQVRRERAERWRTWCAARADYARANAPGVYSAVIYAAALSVAVSGQVSIAVVHQWPIIFGIALAVFVEGTALSMALTAHQLRMKRERALIPRVLTWAAALFAAGVNFYAHSNDRVLACVLAASSLAGIAVWEIRSGAKHRPALRKVGAIPDPPEQFGWRRWLRYPSSTVAAWSLDIRSRVSPRAAALLAQVDRDRAERARMRERTRLGRSARRAVVLAALRGGSGSALVELRRAAAQLLDPADPGPAIPATPTRTPAPRSAPGPEAAAEVRPAGPPPSPARTQERTQEETTGVRDIGSAGSDERFLALVREAHPSGPVAWAQVRDAIAPHLPAMGLKPSKNRIGRVHQKITAERTAQSDDAEERSA